MRCTQTPPNPPTPQPPNPNPTQDFPRFLATIIVGSLAVGLLSGALLLFALSLFSNKLKHYNSQLQISLTIVAAYANFYFAEAVVGASGILSLVLMGCVCGYGFWPMIVNVEQMRGARQPKG